MENLGLFLATFLLVANTLSFTLVGLDKNKSISDSPRIPEVYFFFCSLFFSSLGVLTGMFVFRHKVKKFYFIFGIGLIFIQQLLLIALIWERLK